ncbi:hypothetical protein DFS34DRAFT_652136 [Phlyctochytrium arcticum]|nr:hypothetical protein DFS34DRAFT_652136 [Phlyctochytrium arcticum]
MKMIISGKNMLVQAFLSLLLESVYAAEACHPDAKIATIQYAIVNGSFVTIERATCYHDVAFYYNDALLARPKSEYAWCPGLGNSGLITSNTMEVVLFPVLMSPRVVVPSARTLAPLNR